MKCTQVAKVKLSVLVLLFKQYGSQSQNMVFFILLTINDTSGMNLRIPAQVLDKSIGRKTTKIRLCTKKSTIY